MNFLDFLFPKRCIGCSKIGKYICDDCHSHIQVIDPTRESICPVCERASKNGLTHSRCMREWTIDGLTSFFRYEGVVRKAVKAIKYRLVSDMCKEFTKVVPLTSYNFLQRKIEDKKTIIIPIPLHSARLRQRGFNQAEILGSLVATHLDQSVRCDILLRVRKTTPQVEVKERKNRLKNMQNVFVVNPLTMKQYNNTAIILFDDVFTTGATMCAAATTLKRAGVEWVWGVTMAR